MKPPLSFLVLALMAAFSTAALAKEPRLEVSATRSQIYLGESFVLDVRMIDMPGDSTPDLSALKNCRVRPAGSHSMTQMSIGNLFGGQMQTTVSRNFVYEITPLAAGVFTAGPVTVTASGRTFSAEGTAISVIGVEKQDLVAIEIASSRESVLLDEDFTVTLTLFIRQPTGDASSVEPLDPRAPAALDVPYLNPDPIKGLAGPNMQQVMSGILTSEERPGILINKYSVRRQMDINNMFNMDFGNPFGEAPARFAMNRGIVERDGKTCSAYRLALSYRASEEGNYTFGPAVFKGEVITLADRQRGVARQNIFAVGPACTMRVVPPPEEGRPPDYVGTLGSNMTIEAALDAQTCKVGDPLTLTLALAGNVRLDKILPPRPSLQTNLTQNFAVYEDTVETTKSESRREYAYKLRPLKPGTFEVPPLSVSYYDLRDRVYKTVASAPIPVRVRASEEVGEAEVIADTNQFHGGQSEPGRETSPPASLRTDPRGAEPQALLGGAWILWLAVAGPLVYSLTVGARSALAYRARTAVRRRQRRAFGKARQALRDAAELAGTDALAARKAAYSALQSLLADRLGVAAPSLTPEDAAGLLDPCRLPPDQVRDFLRIMNGFFLSAYASSDGSASLEALCAEAIQLVGRMQEVWR